MDPSGSYAAVESMIHQKKVMLFELKHLVASLERRGLITPRELQALLQLGYKLLPKLPTDPVQSPGWSTRLLIR
jgi:hypothetical protein